MSNNRNIIILIWCGQYSSGSILNCPSPLTFCRNGQSIIEDEPPNNAIKCMRYKLKFSSLPLSIEYTQRKKGTVNVLHALPFDNEPFFWSNERKKNSMKRPALNPCRLWLLFSLSLFLFWAIMICKKKEIIDQRMSARLWLPFIYTDGRQWHCISISIEQYFAKCIKHTSIFGAILLQWCTFAIVFIGHC